ncbi:MAG: 3-hydroxyacyl-CoA dehydrogenase/enoyl-CoA hydratase family protein, partial [Neisseriaceae bacterium]|nr:3-hydroxyacyl-CoA dehydrogenase/enoyl-CoA hydratase family protein [Neisseriaceae bacterium]
SLSYIKAANYEDDLEELKDCDLVIEAVAERLDIKESVYKQVAPHLGENTIFSTNTSGLSIELLCSKFPENLKHRFCGVHFFNPPRYMHLVELIPCEKTDSEYLDHLERFLISTLGKGVVRAKDTPNFVANRLGVFSMLAAIHLAKKYDLRFDVVDDLTGRRLGRPKSATFRTADVVGLDTFSHVAQTMQDGLPDDPWHQYFTQPDWLNFLVEEGKLGSKTGGGIYQKQGKQYFVLDPKTKEYVPSGEKADLEVTELLKIKDPVEKFKALRESKNPQAQFVWFCFAEVFHYIAYHAESMADTAREIDFAIRWGFGWDVGPLETWQAAGIQQVKKWLEEDISAGNTMTKAKLPSWLDSLTEFHNDKGSFKFSDGTYQPRSNLDVYKRQIVPARLLGESRKPLGKTVWESDFVRAFTLDDRVLIIENLNKNHAVSYDVLSGFSQAIDIAEQEFEAVVLWNEDAPFSVGADLKSMMPVFASGDFEAIEKTIKLFQETSMKIRYSQVPVVSAVNGYALGGGCEIVLHSNKVVAALESYIGLVEVGVGLIPGGGGTKEFALRAAKESKGDLLASLTDYYMNIAMAKVAASALEAKETGHLRESDVVVFNTYELLYVAIQEALTLANSGFRPEQPQTFKVGGRTVAASILGQLVNMKKGRFISEYDYYLGKKIAWVMTGGDIENGSIVDEQWILDLERKVFMDLLKNEKTQERIQGMMTTGKAVRN